ncbi:uncharacterized protein LOC115519898 [Lynx canadensis]|uniref:uncharacterized protein LOC115519898 n=1 Tax=Lynx canadensis TaxID=61383 RepID=UPI0011AFED91|nr:uncharacterized protein LOC115519898 [Lynx canadensis]
MTIPPRQVNITHSRKLRLLRPAAILQFRRGGQGRRRQNGAYGRPAKPCQLSQVLRLASVRGVAVQGETRGNSLGREDKRAASVRPKRVKEGRGKGRRTRGCMHHRALSGHRKRVLTPSPLPPESYLPGQSVQAEEDKSLQRDDRISPAGYHELQQQNGADSRSVWTLLENIGDAASASPPRGGTGRRVRVTRAQGWKETNVGAVCAGAGWGAQRQKVEVEELRTAALSAMFSTV